MKTILVLFITLIPAILSQDAPQKPEPKAEPQQQLAAAAVPLAANAEAKQSDMAKQQQPFGNPMQQPFMFGMPMQPKPFPQPMHQPQAADLEHPENKPARQEGGDKAPANQPRPQMNQDPMAAFYQQFAPQMQMPGQGAGYQFQNPFMPQHAYRY